MHTVSVRIDDENGETTDKYTIAFSGNTVADALAKLGIQVADNQEINASLDDKLEDGMEIVISAKEKEETEQETNNDEQNTQEVSAAPVQSNDSGSSSSGSSSSGSSSSGNSSSGSSSSGSSSSGSSSSGNSSSGNSSSGNSSSGNSSSGSGSSGSASQQPTKTVVSVEYYDDCDGSGHGVKVITYSDGTQEEVAY